MNISMRVKERTEVGPPKKERYRGPAVTEARGRNLVGKVAESLQTGRSLLLLMVTGVLVH